MLISRNGIIRRLRRGGYWHNLETGMWTKSDGKIVKVVTDEFIGDMHGEDRITVLERLGI